MRIIHEIVGPAVPSLGTEPYLKPAGAEKSTDWKADVSIHVRNPLTSEEENIFLEGPARYMIPMVERLLEMLHTAHEDYVQEGLVKDYRRKPASNEKQDQDE